MIRPPSERFWALVDRRGMSECWLWRGATTSDGYGAFRLDGAYVGAHRFAFGLVEELRPGLVVRHLCNNRICVNPRHLRGGTHADNRRDAVVAGRQAKGSRNGRAKLCEEDVRRIVRRLADGAPVAALARAHGVTPKAVRQIRDGKAWRCVTARPVQVSAEVAP